MKSNKINDYLYINEVLAKGKSTAFILLILSPVFLIATIGFNIKILTLIGITLLSGLLIAGVVLLFNIKKLRNEYKNIEENEFNLDESVINQIIDYQENNAFKDMNTKVTAICLLILSTLPIFITQVIINSEIATYIGIALMIVFLAISVKIYYPVISRKKTIDKLLKIEKINSNEWKFNIAFVLVLLLAIIIYSINFGFNVGWLLIPLGSIIYFVFMAIYRSKNKM